MFFEWQYVASQRTHARVGIVVPRYSHSAVDRNRVKRRLREILRRDVLPALPPLDLTVRASRLAYDATFGELHAACTAARDKMLGSRT
jgi:ribonuclease P protein component